MEKILPVAEAEEKLRPGRLATVPVIPRISPDDVEAMSADQLLTSVRLAYPEFDADMALSYFNGGMMACRMMGMQPADAIQFVSAWAGRDEYMLVGSLYANIRGLNAQAKKVVIAAAPGMTQ
jgi:hypothetical protein